MNIEYCVLKKNYTSKYIQFLFHKKIHLKKLDSDNNIFDDDAPLLSGSSWSWSISFPLMLLNLLKQRNDAQDA